MKVLVVIIYLIVAALLIILWSMLAAAADADKQAERMFAERQEKSRMQSISDKEKKYEIPG